MESTGRSSSSIRALVLIFATAALVVVSVVTVLDMRRGAPADTARAQGASAVHAGDSPVHFVAGLPEKSTERGRSVAFVLFGVGLVAATAFGWVSLRRPSSK